MYLAFDVGGTKMRLAVSFDGENFHNIETYQTPQDFNLALDTMQKFIWKWVSDGAMNQLCVGLPGVTDREKKVLVAAPNLPFWVGKPIKEDLEKVSNAKVILANDADLAGLGEASRGTAKTASIVTYITIGTGIGGVRIINKKIDVSVLGFEPGHQILDADGSITGKVSDWEELVGGIGIARRYSKPAEQITESPVWSEINKYIALGLINTIVHWSPEIVVLGGSVSQNQNISIEVITSEIRKYLNVFPNLPEIKKGNLGDNAGLYGALEILKSETKVQTRV